MGASTFIGSCGFSATTTTQTIAMDNISYTRFAPTVTEDANNVGWGAAVNDGRIKNDSGKEQVIDGVIAMSGGMVTGSDSVSMIPMTSSDGITFNEMNTNFQTVVGLPVNPRALYLSYTLTIPNGSWVAAGFKNLDVDVDVDCTSFYHFIRSRDGGDSPSLMATSSTDISTSPVEIAIGAADTAYVIGKTTAGFSNQVGVTDNNDGSFTNNTGGTLIVDGWIYISLRSATASARHFFASVGLEASGGGGYVETGLRGGNYASGSPWKPIFMTYTIEMEDGETIAPMVGNLTDTVNTDVKAVEHQIRSRI